MSEEYLSISSVKRGRSHQIGPAIDQTLVLRIDAIVAARSEALARTWRREGGVTGCSTVRHLGTAATAFRRVGRTRQPAK